MWQAVVERFEQHAPACMMARLALEQALPAAWVDEVFEANRQRQYPRELMFSTIVELMTLVTLGLRPSLHAAAPARHMPLTQCSTPLQKAPSSQSASAWHPGAASP